MGKHVQLTECLHLVFDREILADDGTYDKLTFSQLWGDVPSDREVIFYFYNTLFMILIDI